MLQHAAACCAHPHSMPTRGARFAPPPKTLSSRRSSLSACLLCALLLTLNGVALGKVSRVPRAHKRTGPMRAASSALATSHFFQCTGCCSLRDRVATIPRAKRLPPSTLHGTLKQSPSTVFWVLMSVLANVVTGQPQTAAGWVTLCSAVLTGNTRRVVCPTQEVCPTHACARSLRKPR